MPRLWGTPELKDKQAEGEDWRWKEWHGMGSSTMAQVDKQERAARQAKTLGGQELREGEQETPGMQRNTAQAGGTFWHQEVMGKLQSQWTGGTARR